MESIDSMDSMESMDAMDPMDSMESLESMESMYPPSMARHGMALIGTARHGSAWTDWHGTAQSFKACHVESWHGTLRHSMGRK